MDWPIWKLIFFLYIDDKFWHQFMMFTYFASLSIEVDQYSYLILCGVWPVGWTAFHKIYRLLCHLSHYGLMGNWCSSWHSVRFNSIPSHREQAVLHYVSSKYIPSLSISYPVFFSLLIFSISDNFVLGPGHDSHQHAGFFCCWVCA